MIIKKVYSRIMPILLLQDIKYPMYQKSLAVMQYQTMVYPHKVLIKVQSRITLKIQQIN